MLEDVFPVYCLGIQCARPTVCLYASMRIIISVENCENKSFISNESFESPSHFTNSFSFSPSCLVLVEMHTVCMEPQAVFPSKCQIHSLWLNIFICVEFYNSLLEMAAENE